MTGFLPSKCGINHGRFAPPALIEASVSKRPEECKCELCGAERCSYGESSGLKVPHQLLVVVSAGAPWAEQWLGTLGRHKPGLVVAGSSARAQSPGPRTAGSVLI